MATRCADNVVFVQCILPHREYLFSKFSPKITHEGKKVRWLYIRDQLVATGMTHFVGKDDSYMRQKWADMKRRTIEKLGRVGQNSRANLSKVDVLILRIIGDKETNAGAEVQTIEQNDQIDANNVLDLNVDQNNATVYNENLHHHQSLLEQQVKNLTQNSTNLVSAKCELNIPPIGAAVVPLQQHGASPAAEKMAPSAQAASSSSAPPVSSFTSTITANGLPFPTTLRRKRKKFFKQRSDRMPRPYNNSNNNNNNSYCQNGMLRIDQQHQTAAENGDLDEQIKRAKLAYYKSQIDLNNSLKSESIMRKRLLTLQIEQIRQEIEGNAEEDIDEEH